MYAMFLVATGGRRKIIRRVVRRADNSFEETVEEEMFGPTGPLHAIVSLFRGRTAKEKS
jgi:spore germination protein GerM